MKRILDTATHSVEVPNDATINGSGADTRLEVSVSIAGAPDSRRTVVALGATTSINMEIKDSDGNTVTLSDTFAVPVRRIGGAVERTIGISFTDGVASKSINWPNSGEFEITEDLINMHLPPEQHFKFNRLVFSVYE